jgi:sporulation protein YlmC with PRC-barrel domain
VDLVRDLLDNQVVDRHGTKLGKVDSVIIRLSDGRAPRVAAIQVGVPTVAERVHPRLRQWVEAVERRWGVPLGCTRIPWARVRSVGLDVHVDLDAERTRAFALERWLRRLIARIPGAG